MAGGGPTYGASAAKTTASEGRTRESRALLWALIMLDGVLTWIAPASLVVLLALPWLPRLPLALVAYAGAEAVFLLEFVLIRRPSLLALSAPLPAPSATERDRIFGRVMSELEHDGVDVARERYVLALDTPLTWTGCSDGSCGTRTSREDGDG